MNILARTNDVSTLPWWIILIIIAGGLLLLAIYPIFRMTKKTKKKVLEIPTKDEPLKEAIKDSKNTPYWGIYNWFGKKQALRTTVTIYVQETEDPCDLCRPFENKVLSLEEYGQNVTLMSEAISRGYHHVGCRHIDIDYFHGTTKIPLNKWTIEEKKLRYMLRLKQYKFEEGIRDLKYRLDNENRSNTVQDKMIKELKIKQSELNKFCIANNLPRNEMRENSSISDIDKFN